MPFLKFRDDADIDLTEIDFDCGVLNASVAEIVRSAIKNNLEPMCNFANEDPVQIIFSMPIAADGHECLWETSLAELIDEFIDENESGPDGEKCFADKESIDLAKRLMTGLRKEADRLENKIKKSP